MSITKQELQEFRNKADKMLEELGKEMGFNIRVGNISYTESSFTAKLEATRKEVNGKSFEQATFEKYCVLYDLKPEDFGKEFISSGNRYVIRGINTKANKYPIEATRVSDSKQYKFTASVVKTALSNKEAI